MKANYRNVVSFFILVSVVRLEGQEADFGALSFEEVRAEAKKGDVEAQREMGWRYYNGQGVPQNYEEAGKWYDQAAKHKHSSVFPTVVTASASTNFSLPEGFILEQKPVFAPSQPFASKLPQFNATDPPGKIRTELFADIFVTNAPASTGLFDDIVAEKQEPAETLRRRLPNPAPRGADRAVVTK